MFSFFHQIHLVYESMLPAKVLQKLLGLTCWGARPERPMDSASDDHPFIHKQN